jgi:hypothetical protein
MIYSEIPQEWQYLAAHTLAQFVAMGQSEEAALGIAAAVVEALIDAGETPSSLSRIQ